MKPSSVNQASMKLVEIETSASTADSYSSIQTSKNVEIAACEEVKSEECAIEHDLILAAQKHDKAAFKALYTMHMPRVYALCCRLCADRSQAEDATQEVFIQLWRKIQNFKGESKFSTWLHSVAANVTVSYIRKQRGWWQKMINIEDSPLSEREAEASFADSDFEKLIYRLPERARHVFVLHAIHGYKHEQISETLDMAVGTSKAQFHRARKLLEEWLSE